MAPPKAVKQPVAAVAQTAALEASNPTAPSGIDIACAMIFQGAHTCMALFMELTSSNSTKPKQNPCCCRKGNKRTHINDL
ncbi:hypothetical protein H5410_006746 [Solanum commersonii]|uniref:Uncharacterized protein n=1 Tax=Solanum commersonii TaxID=4109 RepID=A0A9J6AAM4_SOLCO|nr:hypothetical protein H5410_006746 [Solanum commersonii]